MSLKNALETAKEILENADLHEADMMKMKKNKLASGGDNTEVEMTADGEGSKSADGVTPKIAKPVKPGGAKPRREMRSLRMHDDKDEEEWEYAEGEVGTPGQTMKIKRLNLKKNDMVRKNPRTEKENLPWNPLKHFQELFSSKTSLMISK